MELGARLHRREPFDGCCTSMSHRYVQRSLPILVHRCAVSASGEQ
jgi:hypothetical protein